MWKRLLVWVVVLPVAALLIVPSVMTLMKADDPMPVPEETWTMQGEEVTAAEDGLAGWAEADWVREMSAEDGVSGSGGSGVGHDPNRLPPGPLRPDTVYVPALKIVMPFHDAGQTDGWLDMEYGAVNSGVRFDDAGDFQAGSQVIAAHVNNRKLEVSPFIRLNDATAGMVVVVTDADAVPFYYKTTALNYYDKGELPEGMWDEEGYPSVHLVTCGGRIAVSPYDGRRHYTDNVVLRAEAFTPSIEL